MKIAPDNASLLLLVSLFATFMTVGTFGLVAAGYIPFSNQDPVPHTGSIDTSVSENEEIKFQVTNIGNADAFIIEQPNGDRTRLSSTGESAAFNTEDGTYMIYTEINGYERMHQSIHPQISDIDVNEHNDYTGRQRI